MRTTNFHFMLMATNNNKNGNNKISAAINGQQRTYTTVPFDLMQMEMHG